MWRLIDISGEGYYFHVKNKNILIEKDGKEIDTVSFADVNSVIVHGNRNSYSEEFLSACIEHYIPFIICNDKHLPSGMLLGWYQHTNAASRMEDQIHAKLPRKKQAWSKIVKAKVLNQAELLLSLGYASDSNALNVMAYHVLSGDSSNIEAQAARTYFPIVFGTDFIRSEDDDINSHLNYGYTILRSMVARAIVGAGLCPSISIFHSNRINPYALCDDLIEPLRPFADWKVCEIMKSTTGSELTPASKKSLISLITLPVLIKGQEYELTKATEIYVYSYYRFIRGESNDIEYPKFYRE